MSQIWYGWERGKPLDISKMGWWCGLQCWKHFLNGPTWNLEDYTNLSNLVTCVPISKTKALVELTSTITFIPLAMCCSSLDKDSIEAQWDDLAMQVLLFWLSMDGINYLRLSTISSLREFHIVVYRDSAE